MNLVFGMVERVGTRLYHPVMLFVILVVRIIVISEILARLGITISYTDVAGENVVVEVVALMTGDRITYLFNTAVSNFIGFAPLGTVLETMLGVEVAESNIIKNVKGNLFIRKLQYSTKNNNRL